MCNPLSICVTKDARVLSVPGRHHHTTIIERHFGETARRGHSEGTDLAGLELNLRRRVVVLDERVVPAWWQSQHEDAIWSWLMETVGSREDYHRFAGLEFLHTPRLFESSIGRDFRFIESVWRRDKLNEERIANLGIGQHGDRVRAMSPEMAMTREKGFLTDLGTEIQGDRRWEPWWEKGQWRLSANPKDLDVGRLN